MSALRDLLDGDYVVSAHHQALNPICVHSSVLDLAQMIDRLGEDFDLREHRAWLCARLRCTACGRKGNIVLTFVPVRKG